MEQLIRLNGGKEIKGPPRQMIDEYEINPFTMVVMPIHYGSKIYSRILELEDECISPFKPLDIIKESCDFFGVPYEGRKNGTRKLIGATRKIPIAISPPNFIYFFPTTSPDKPQCIWVALEHVVDYERTGKDITTVTFKNNQKVHIPISFGSFRNQVGQTVMLKSKLSQRIEKTNQKYSYTNSIRMTEASEKTGSYEYYSNHNEEELK